MSASSSKSHKDAQIQSAPTEDLSVSTHGMDSIPSPSDSLSDSVDDQQVESAPDTAENPFVNSNRQQPIPPPSEPMQYRAIGLVEGKYQPSEERFNRGTLTTRDGTELNAVLLGQVMSLVKKYVDLDQNYLWVVYPRTREKEEMLHLQIVGVWSAGGFGPIAEYVDPEAVPEPLTPPLKDGYFSVRGQIVYQSEDKKTLFVKIQQAARKNKERAKDFKLKLNGVLEQKAIGYFWDLHIQRNGTELEVVEGTSIAAMPVKKRPPMGGRRRPPGGPGGGGSGFQRPSKPQRAQRGEPGTSQGSKPKPVTKPVKRNTDSDTN
jgi:hypothetical protein